MLDPLLRWFYCTYSDVSVNVETLQSSDFTVVLLVIFNATILFLVIPLLLWHPPALLRLKAYFEAKRRIQRVKSLGRNRPKSRPLIVLVNPTSGGQLGLLLMKRLKAIYRPELVFDITAPGGPAKAISAFGSNCRVMVAGGDGTARWVLDTIDSLAITPQPPVAVLPLGTGNDLSRTLNWGGGAVAADISSDEFLYTHLSKVCTAKVRRIDRWNVLVGGTCQRMVNYFSFGIDAQIALKFHNARQQNPSQFTTQAGNIARYAMYGFEGAMEGTPLGDGVTLTVDGVAIPVSSRWKGIVVVNVPCYHGGSDFWGKEEGTEFHNVEFDDGKLEVMGLVGTLHIGMVHIGMDSAIRVAQGHQIVFTMPVPAQGLAMQVDGEPWLQTQGPCTVDIRAIKSSMVLVA